MRDWFDGILTFIGTSTLTDLEFAGMNVLNIDSGVYSQAAFDELSKVITAGVGSVLTMTGSLACFRPKGSVSVAESKGSSQIFLGADLE